VTPPFEVRKRNSSFYAASDIASDQEASPPGCPVCGIQIFRIPNREAGFSLAIRLRLAVLAAGGSAHAELNKVATRQTIS
jgi:hypothetical protein